MLSVVIYKKRASAAWREIEVSSFRTILLLPTSCIHSTP